MDWVHARIVSTADDGVAMVIAADDGWEALPFGADGGSCGVYPTREEAVRTVEGVLGDMICCVGHLAADADG
ncbi:MAG: hypothetical protein JNM75_06645 [Rhodospirillales bacterium]|nr:hypothetical protein [Rhodospirillales bacterium]